MIYYSVNDIVRFWVRVSSELSNAGKGICFPKKNSASLSNSGTDGFSFA